MAVFLGIDIGTSATKALAMTADGAVLSESTSSYPCHHPRPTWSEQDPALWWHATVESVRAVIKQAGLGPADVTGIGLSGQMHGAVFLDKDNQVICPAILWNDQRTVAECNQIEDLCWDRQKLVELVANRAITGFTAPKILWLRNNEPDNFEKTRKILLPKDYVRLKLTGDYATDVSDASGMLLLDVAGRKWSKTMLSMLDLSEDLLPPCVESPTITGTLTRESAELLGLTTNCFVVAGAGDCAASAIGNGIVSSGILSTSIGTSGVMMVHSDSCTVDPDSRIHTICHAVPGKWLMMGVNLSAGGCLQWFAQQLCKAEYESTMAGKSTSDNFYELLIREAQEVRAGSDGLFFLPYLSGERTPYFDADARGCFIGLTMAHTRGHLVRAIMEGVGYNLSQTLQIIAGLNVPVNEIRVSGGGSRSHLWRQIQADMFAQNVIGLNAEEGPAYGVALLAAVGGGSYASIEEACKATIHAVNKTCVSEDDAAYYARGFPLFRRLYHSLAREFKEMAIINS